MYPGSDMHGRLQGTLMGAQRLGETIRHIVGGLDRGDLSVVGHFRPPGRNQIAGLTNRTPGLTQTGQNLLDVSAEDRVGSHDQDTLVGQGKSVFVEQERSSV